MLHPEPLDHYPKLTNPTRAPRLSTLASAVALCRQPHLFESDGMGQFRQTASLKEMAVFENRDPSSVAERLRRLSRHRSPTSGDSLVSKTAAGQFVINLDAIKETMMSRNADRSNVVFLSSRAKTIQKGIEQAGYQLRTGTGDRPTFVHTKTSKPLTLAAAAEITGARSLGTAHYWKTRLESSASLSEGGESPDPESSAVTGQHLASVPDTNSPWKAAVAAFQALCACPEPTQRHLDAFYRLVSTIGGCVRERREIANTTPESVGFREFDSREIPHADLENSLNDNDFEKDHSSHPFTNRDRNPNPPSANPIWSEGDFARIIDPYRRRWAEVHNQAPPIIHMPSCINSVSADQLKVCISKLLENPEQHANPGGLLHSILQKQDPQYLSVDRLPQPVIPSLPGGTDSSPLNHVRVEDIKGSDPGLMVDMVFSRCRSSGETSTQKFTLAWKELAPSLQPDDVKNARAYIQEIHGQIWIPHFDAGIAGEQPIEPPAQSHCEGSPDF